jgi:transcription elongation factor GreA
MIEYLTAEGLKKIKEELHELKTTKTKEIADMLKYAASFGDLKENAGYDEAKERQSWLIRRIMELETIIGNAKIYEKKDGDSIQVGSKISILLDGATEDMEIVAPSESNILTSKISYQSPLGQKLIGKKVNDEFYFGEEDGKIKVKILKIQ